MAVATLAAAGGVVAGLARIPRASLATRGDFCGQYDTSASQRSYLVSNNLWGADNGSGFQCTGTESFNKGGVQWHTSWTWSGSASSVKSYANVAYQLQPQQLVSIKSISSKWSWSYNQTEIDANVAFDLYTSSSAAGSQEYEIMLWLGTYGQIGPLASSYSSSGAPQPTASGLSLAGLTVDLYSGGNGQQTTYSFVSHQNATDWNGDLKELFDYLIDHQGFKASQYLVTVQAGTEAFGGAGARLENDVSIEIQ